jgi:hypothetical protein
MLKAASARINPKTKRLTLKVTRSGKREFKPSAKSAKVIAVATQ